MSAAQSLAVELARDFYARPGATSHRALVANALLAADERISVLESVLLGTHTKNDELGVPCWCPGWMLEEWRDEDDPAERSHHMTCIRARDALGLPPEVSP